MGGSVSTGVDNDDLIDNLRDADYIRTPMVERVFRAVDRGEYMLPEFRMNAYKDQAWRGNSLIHLHLSAPCIYSEVLEGLNLHPGLSFLNLGSGTGYLSTMAGLILGHNGINHGIEFYEEVVDYANKKLEDFKKYSGAIDEFDFCEPKFMTGNCLCLTTDRLYDRVYVGAACPEPYESFMKNLLQVNGILVMPFNDQLLQVKRISLSSWNVSTLLPVSFATLVLPKEGTKELFELMEIEPQSLQSICRSLIRNILRKNIDCEMPELKSRKHASTAHKQNKKRRIQRHDESDNDEDVQQFLGLVKIGSSTTITINHRLGTYAEWLTDEECASDDSSDEDDKNGDNKSPGCKSKTETETVNIETKTSNETTSTSEETERSNRKFDSGIGDESQSDEVMSAHDDNDETECSRESNPTWEGLCHRHFSDLSSSSGSDREDPPEKIVEDSSINMYERRIISSPYTYYMCSKINELPLPPILKDYLSFHRL